MTCLVLAGALHAQDSTQPSLLKLELSAPKAAFYMGEMIPVIRKYNGYVSQMAGDGIYFFFGAPQPDTHHAETAIGVTFGMFTALIVEK